MYKIQFIGNLNQSAEFASKWKEKLVPDQVKGGKELRQIIATNVKELNTPAPPNKAGFTITIKNARENRKELEDLYKNKLQRQARQTRKDYKINKDPEVSDNLNNKIYKSNKTSLSAKGQQKLKELKSAYKKRKFIANIGKAKTFIGKNKLGIGAVGLTTAGAIGYKIIRKMRSDKGKKRGFYNR